MLPFKPKNTSLLIQRWADWFGILSLELSLHSCTIVDLWTHAYLPGTSWMDWPLLFNAAQEAKKDER